MLALHLDEFSPQVVRAGRSTITLAGRVRNVAQRNISGVAIRLQVGPRLASAQAVFRALNGPVRTARAASAFTTVARKLRPGQSAHFSERVPVGTLGLGKAGLYPLLVNVNGQPAYSGRARLASLSMLLPVRSAPGESEAPGASSTAGSSGTARDEPAARVAMLWPLVDEHPRIVGRAQGKTVLSDDGLARSLRPGGRLYGLLDALAREGSAHPDLLRGACFAIDPELLAAVSAMRGGYLVSSGGRRHPGSGQPAAVSWLSRLRDLTDNRCVIPLPYADADLVSLTHAHLAGLAKRSLGTGVVSRVLAGAHVRSDIRWPAGGYLDRATLRSSAYRGATVVAASTRPDAATDPGTAHPVAGAKNVSAIGLDGLVRRGLAGHPRRAVLPPGATTPAGQPAVGTQNGIATLLFRARFETHRPPAVLIAPPRRWDAPEAELRRFLATLARLEHGHLLTPKPPEDLLAAHGSTNPVAVEYPTSAAEREISSRAMNVVARQNARLGDIGSIMSQDPAGGASPSDVLSPLYRALLAAASGAHRGRGHPATRAALDAARTAKARIGDLADEVSLANVHQTISLTSKKSPLPISIDNDLPVLVTVRVHLATAAIQPRGTLIERVPPASSRTFYLPTKVARSGRFTVKARLTTPDGTPLGSTARLEVSSGAYGSIVPVITGVAFAVLLLLAGRRVYSRVRSPARAGSRAGRDAGKDARSESTVTKPNRR
jgi:hypothetical protein